MGAINPTEQGLLHLRSAPEGRVASVNNVPSDRPPQRPSEPSGRMHPSRIVVVLFSVRLRRTDRRQEGAHRT